MIVTKFLAKDNMNIAGREGYMKEYSKVYDSLKGYKIKGVAEKTLEKLRAMGIETLYDLIYHFPRAYEDQTNFKSIINLRQDEYAVIKGRIAGIENRKLGHRKNITKARVADPTGFLEVVWFNMPHLKYSLKTGEEYIFIGNIKKGYNFQMVGPEYKKVEEDTTFKGEILPIYGLTKSVKQTTLRKIIRDALTRYRNYFSENIPEEVLEEYQVMKRVEALEAIHFPRNAKAAESAKRRFAIEELLVLQMGILEKRFRADVENTQQYKLQDNKHLVKMFLEGLHFRLTDAQKRVITEIYRDLNNGRITNRLIQGDVGSGKTMVAMVMLLYMVENSYQGVIMAPTEILAVQHYLSMGKVFEKMGIKTAILTGSVKGKAREKLLLDIKSGNIDIVVGTHAVIEDSVEFHKLGLIVIDEQHRFGVEQRRRLREKGVLANLLVMSATPIPRSLALSIYGDLDVSVIDELPPGRKPIKTKWLNTETDLEKAYDFIEKKLVSGRQAYFVAPLIEESEKLTSKSATELHQEISERFSNFKVGILHGRMKNSEKDEIMRDFKENKLQVLVSTTVIEVGVNVPNASVMVISSAERFGLSALHQLRGRIGRGEHASYCFLISNTENDVSKSRLQVMEETIDGFKIAEEDLRLRKPGEIFGTRQSGVTDLKFVDIVHDVKTIKLVRDISIKYLKENLGKIENTYLKEDIKNKFHTE